MKPRSTKVSSAPSELVRKVSAVIGAVVGLSLGIAVTVSAQGKLLPAISTVICTTTAGAACQPSTTMAVEASLVNMPIIFSNIPQRSHDALLNTGFLLHSYLRIWPDAVQIVVEQAPLLYQIKTPDGSYGVMDNRRVAVLHEPQQTLYTVHMEENLRPTEFSPPWLHTAVLATIETIKPSSMELVSPIELRVNAQNGPMDFILNPQEIKENLGRMRVLLSSPDTTNYATQSGELDVRLRLPVLRKSP